MKSDLSMENKALRILQLEDDANDLDLVCSILESEGLECEIVPVQTRDSFIAALEQHEFDLILADYSLPMFDGLSALALAREAAPETPFILLSGTLGEEFAIDSMKAGATDYVLKQRLSRLMPSVKRALREATGRMQRKLAEKALGASEEKYRILVENANDAIFVVQDGAIKFPNPKTEDLTGYTKTELLELPFTQFVHPGDRGVFLDGYKKEMDKQSPSGTYSFRIINKTEKVLWVQLNSVLIDWEGHPAALIFLRDVTQQRQLESQLQLAQKMEALGTLAGGIAHDFNNILAAVVGYSELAIEDAGDNANLRKSLHQVLKAGERAGDLVKQILTFSRKEDPETKPVRINTLIKQNIRMLRSIIPASIDIKKNFCTEELIINANSSQINQVILNLMTNSSQAISDNGIIEVCLEAVNVKADHPEPYLKMLSPGDYALIKIRDSGQGIPREKIDFVFDPYFTTKAPDKGTGLGLAVVHGIVNMHGGNISVSSQVGQGTTFFVYLPMIEALVPEVSKNQADSIPHGVERILLVDDEPGLVELQEIFLKRIGYSITTSTDSIEAFNLFRAAPHDFDLVVTDMAMPNMTGAKLTEKIKALNPELPVILCTGFSEQINAKTAGDLSIEAFLMKPVRMKKLANTVRGVLDKRIALDFSPK